LALPVIADVYRIAIFMKSPGPELINVLWISRPLSTAQAVGDDFRDLMAATPYWRAEQSVDLIWTKVECTPLDGFGLTTVSLFPTGLSGGESAEPAPLNVAGIITWRTNLRGKSHRGRSYIPSLPVTLVADNGQLWQSILVTTMQNHVNDYMDDANSAGLTPVVVSQALGTATDIQNGLFRAYLGSRRDRLTPRPA